MANEHRVYLDHLIPRESLRLQRPEAQVTDPKMMHLSLQDLRDPVRSKFLRKPDFQRETWAWTPEDCVSLLESLTNRQVIPSIIMWASADNGYEYILDGGHRVSVILAWMRDDWGDNLPKDQYRDDEHESMVKDAAREVRRLVNQRVGSIKDYEAAETEIDRIVNAGESPKTALPEQIFRRGIFFQRVLKGYETLHVLWVQGDYEKAEQSFLKINKSGRQLSDWEIKLIDNRNSSFARVMMSVASISSAKHYWPLDDKVVANDTAARKKVEEILAGINFINDTVFKPSPQDNIKQMRQPLLVATGTHQRPYYLAEMLTVIQGGRGQPAETDRLLAEGRNDPPHQIIESGYKLVNDTVEALNHLVGPSTNPTSLSIVPLAYFYTKGGRYVRSMLYGFLFWLLQGGNPETIRNRKRVFSGHRAAFESILLQHKDEIISGLTRRTGSGPDITAQTAAYFDGLVRLLVVHNDAIGERSFSDAYEKLVKETINRLPREPQPEEPRGRIFTDRQQSIVILKEMWREPIRCGICGGILDIASALQFDHVQEASKGGLTVSDNARLAHPFCNNPANRVVIEQIRQGQSPLALPDFKEPIMTTGSRQMTFFDDPEFNPAMDV
jgi:hypothetical protein